MDKVQESLKERYAHLHPLIFQRSLEKATSNGDLFDILSSVPDEYPIVWNDAERQWTHTENLVQSPIQQGKKDE